MIHKKFLTFNFWSDSEWATHNHENSVIYLVDTLVMALVVESLSLDNSLDIHLTILVRNVGFGSLDKCRSFLVDTLVEVLVVEW